MVGLSRRAALAGGVALSSGVTGVARAQAEWPKGPIRFVIPFPPGGTTDPVGRLLQSKVAENTGWQIVADNKPGAAGAIGAGIAAKSPPDGQTWMVTFDSHILSPAFTPNLPYKDSELMNVMLVGRAPLIAVCPPDRPYKTYADVVADAKQRPGKVSIGVLSASQALLIGTHLQKANGFQLNTIYYKGGGPTVQDVLAGVLDTSITTMGAVLPHVRAGKMKALATTGDKRPAAFPDTPTMAELGISTYPTYSWWGVYAPAGTPKPIVDRMHAELVKAVRSSDVRQKFTDTINMEEIIASTPEEFAAFQKSEQERWFKVIKDNDIKAE